MLAPMIWMISVSLKSPQEIFTPELHLIPQNFSAWENYRTALTEVPLLGFMLNGVIVCSGILVFQIAFAVPSAYAIAKLRFRGRETLFTLVILGLLIPPQVPAIPLYVVFAKLGLLNSYTALIAPFTISVFAIFLFRQFFKSVSDDLIYAARVDGLNEFSIVWRILMPMAWPTATAFAIFSVVAHWNDLYWPLIVINDYDHATTPIGVVFFRDAEAGDNYGALMAATVITTAPLVLGFLLAQRRFIDGITMGAIKG
jgi:multiple sugar transport system permease protein